MTDHMFYLGCTWHTPYPESVSLNIRFGMKSRNRAAVLISGSGVQHLLARSLRARCRRLRSKNFSLSHLLRKSLLRRDRRSVRRRIFFPFCYSARRQGLHLHDVCNILEISRPSPLACISECGIHLSNFGPPPSHPITDVI